MSEYLKINNYDWYDDTVNLDSSGNEDVTSKKSDKADIWTNSAYLEGQYRPIKLLKMIAGIRHENHNAFGYEDLPRFGIVVNPSETTALKLNYGKHFRAPTPNDLFWPEDSFTRGNPNLKPETGKHIDAGIEQKFFDDKLFFSLTYFKWNIDDKINWAENPNYPDGWGGYKWTPSNVDKYYADGLEFEGKIKPFSDLIWTLGYTYTDATEEKKDSVSRPALYVPQNQFKTSLTYFNDSGFTASSTVRYTDDRPGRYAKSTDSSASNILSSYWTMDVKLEERFKHWLFSLSAENIFNKEYGTYIESFKNQDTGKTTQEEYIGAGASIALNVAYEY